MSQDMLARLNAKIKEIEQGPKQKFPEPEGPKDHKFWKTQPVPQWSQSDTEDTSGAAGDLLHLPQTAQSDEGSFKISPQLGSL